MLRAITKTIFLESLECLTRGWLLRRRADNSELTVAERFRMEEGREVGLRARQLYPDGILVSATNPDIAVQDTASLIRRKAVQVIFEPAFKWGEHVARPDILRRSGRGWDVLEVKAATDGTSGLGGYIADLAYSCTVAKKAGLAVNRAFLVLISKEYRLGMPIEALFTEYECTPQVKAEEEVLATSWDHAAEATAKRVRPRPVYDYKCRGCDFFPEACFGETIEHPVWNLPRIGKEHANRAISRGIRQIHHVPDEDLLAGRYFEIIRSVKTGVPHIGASLADQLSGISWPAYYLDFETVQTAIPLYPDTAPYEQVVTQYSLHKCGSTRDFTSPRHFEYLADPSRDCRRELAESLLGRLGRRGSVVVYYAPFERSRLQELAAKFPDLAPSINAVVRRLVDLLDIVKAGVYHPGFSGSYSIKKVLPALVPELSYSDLDIRDGSTAVAQFAEMARGQCPPGEADAARRRLLEYCKRDTEAMVRLHEKLLGLCQPS